MIRVTEPAAFDLVAECLNRYSQEIESMARRKGHHDPADFVGDLALDLCRRSTHIAPHHATRSYLFWLAHKRLCDYHRRRASRRKEIRLSGEVIASDANATEEPEIAIENTTQTLVAQNLAKLNPRHRDVIERKYLMDQSNEEIAAVLGMTNNGVRSALFRTEKRLHELLAPTI